MTLPLLQMCNISFLSKQLDLLLTLRELPVGMNDLQPVSSRHLPWSPTSAGSVCLQSREQEKGGTTTADVHIILLKALAGVKLQTEMKSQSRDKLTLTQESFYTSFVLEVVVGALAGWLIKRHFLFI